MEKRLRRSEEAAMEAYPVQGRWVGNQYGGFVYYEFGKNSK